MGILRSRWLRSGVVVAATAVATIGISPAQDAPQDPAAKAKGKMPAGKARAPGLLAPGGAPPKARRPNAADPLGKRAQAAQPANEPNWPYHWKLKIGGGDGSPLAATYYPAKAQLNAPVLLLIHDKGQGRSGIDFQEPISDLKGQSLADSLQDQGYAVLVVDLRGHGTNPRQELTQKQWQAMVTDVQAAYQFLVDRHNRGELNIAKLGIIALGEGANLVLAWAATPGAAVSSEGRLSDLAALVLISPAADSQGLRLDRAVAMLAPRVPMLLIAGERDQVSARPVKEVQPIVERHRISKVTFFDTALHGYRLLQFFPKVAGTISRFLDDPVKFRINEWEPRYLLNAIATSDVVRVDGAARPSEPAKKDTPKKDAAKKDAPKKKAVD